MNGEVGDPGSELGQHVNMCWLELAADPDRSLVHWLRRLVFRGAWLDQRVKEGELDVRFDERTGTFAYRQPEEGGELVHLSPAPSWAQVVYRP